MFKVPKGSRAAKSAQERIPGVAPNSGSSEAFRKGLAGEETMASDVNGSCRAIFNGQ